MIRTMVPMGPISRRWTFLLPVSWISGNLTTSARTLRPNPRGRVKPCWFAIADPWIESESRYVAPARQGARLRTRLCGDATVEVHECGRRFVLAPRVDGVPGGGRLARRASPDRCLRCPVSPPTSAQAIGDCGSPRRTRERSRRTGDSFQDSDRPYR